MLAAFGVCAAYQLSNQGRGWLWVASGLLVVQWIGDSLDGTLARVRGIQRPKYGYYVFDVIGLAIVAVMLALLTVRVFGNLRELAKEEPSTPRG